VIKKLKKLLGGGPKIDFTGVKRNDDCPCGSGEKFKHCCIDKVEAKARADRDAKLFGSQKG
jgi:SEC-C motif